MRNKILFPAVLSVIILVTCIHGADVVTPEKLLEYVGTNDTNFLQCHPCVMTVYLFRSYLDPAMKLLSIANSTICPMLRKDDMVYCHQTLLIANSVLMKVKDYVPAYSLTPTVNDVAALRLICGTVFHMCPDRLNENGIRCPDCYFVVQVTTATIKEASLVLRKMLRFRNAIHELCVEKRICLTSPLPQINKHTDL